MSLLLEYCQDLYILNEAFYGKPREFIEVEKRLEKIIQMIKLTKEHPEKAININDMKELYEIETILTNFFGNNDTDISFYVPIANTITTGLEIVNVKTPQQLSDILSILDYKGYNAFTKPTSLSFFKKSSNKRLADPKYLYINVFIDIGMIYALDLTPQELMALILHEIGHCFDASLFSLISQIDVNIVNHFIRNGNKITKIEYRSESDIINQLVQSLTGFMIGILPIAKFYTYINRLMTASPIINSFFSELNYLLNDILSLIYTIKNYKTYLLMIKNPVSIATDLLNPKNTFGYAGEKFADSFATSYGYGKDIASVIHKMQINKGRFTDKLISNIPILNIGYDLTKVMIETATSLSSPHPDASIRIKSQLTKLKRDLNDPNLSPKLKYELNNNIKELEDYINNTLLNIYDDSNKGRWISYIKNYIMIKIFNGKLDPRELFEVVWNHEL